MSEEEREVINRLRLPKLHTGMRVEVLTLANQLIFVGVVEVLKETKIKVTEESGQKVPWVEYNTKVKLRGFQRDGIPFSLYGYISGSTDRLWQIDRLEALQLEELRNFYRQNVNIPGTAMCVNQIFAPERGARTKGSTPVPCRVMDISGGGVRIRCAKSIRFEKGDWLFFSADSPLEEDTRMNYTCCVRRVVDGKDYSEYGCEFDNLTETEQETLPRIVMTFQQRELRARRRNNDY